MSSRAQTSKQPRPDERRKHKRVSVRLPVFLHLAGTSPAVEAVILNLSEGGAFIQASLKVTIGQRMLIELRSTSLDMLRAVAGPEEDPLGNDAAVRWSSGADGFGVKFSGLSDESKEFIRKVISQHDPA